MITNSNTTQPNAATQYSVDDEPTASFHALLNKRIVQSELEDLPPHGDVAMLVTATTPHSKDAYYVIPSDDPAECGAMCATIASHMEAQGVVAAAMTSTTINRQTGDEAVVVMASDGDGTEEAWIAQVERDGVNAPTLSEWERVDMGGRFMFMLHVGVGNNAGVCRLAQRDGVPPDYTRPS